MDKRHYFTENIFYGPPPKVPTTFSVKEYEDSKRSPTKANSAFQLIKKCFDLTEKKVSELNNENIYKFEDVKEAVVSATGLSNAASINGKLWRACREITHQKIRQSSMQSSSNSSTVRNHKKNNNKPVNQATIVREFWYYIISREMEIFRVMLLQYQKVHRDIGSGKYCDGKIFNSFTMKSGLLVEELFLILSYVLENFTILVYGDRQYNDANTIMHSILIGTIIDTYKDNFPAFVNEFLDSQRSLNVDIGKWLHVWVPLIRVPDTIDMKAIYFDNVEKYYSENIRKPAFVGSTFASGLQDTMERELEFASHFREFSLETLYRKVWSSLLFKASLYPKMFYLCKNDFRYNKQGKILFRTVVTKFCKKVSQDGRIDSQDYLNAQKMVISSNLNGCFNPLDKIKLVRTVCDLRGYFHDPDQEEILKGCVNDLLLNDNVTMMDIFLETFKEEINLSLDKLHKLSENVEEMFRDSNNRLSIHDFRRKQKLLFPHSSYLNQFVKIPKIFGFGSNLPKIICDYCFKELIINFEDFSMLFRIPRSPLMKLIVELKKGYSSSDDIIMLENLLKEVSDMSRLTTAYKHLNENEILKTNMIVLQRSKFNDKFSERDYKDIKIPPEIHEQWNKLMNFYEQRINNGELQDVIPIYQLQRCEVNCPFNIPGYDKGITFDVTLLQACVLQEFNDRDEISFNELNKLTKLDKNILQAVLKSFVSSRLMIKDGANVKLNLNYEPDIDKIKYNKIMIPMGKIVTKKSVTGSTSISNSSRTTSNTVQHPEGLSSQWKQELLRAAITRTIKRSRVHFEEQELITNVRAQVSDFSIGEFKAAVQFLVQNNYIVADGENYAYNLD
ncbi:similar to Saccharomyces cerevisiae RTT101 Cullin subunit of a Roc1p-dependent E3 ubiquitin ligase complex with a role in anaphase progression [Maudiozyma saulgeensis]|uniref:Similar to Saccharomyces cerevisiae RTT101 Cullin subunit of a Roc1p-dependent E3 ubiquitin ligase complex with a role in anaphase progression n=1 Tax=Maudiozyma saulgeensis TaxID=1789683 RepID=A0A1X7R3M8_9SACH|nr:similar to Saccharomyces cerevisiae RTT101 Cullin subunit of a Roc1p-dependent E3 ubiquitin ligase complex with a role in anaphase progression [Kazachstania saulgeensis]